MTQRDFHDAIGEHQHRTFKLDLASESRAIDEDARTVELAFSSEAPVERFFGNEILDHSTRAVRLGRLTDGAALLLQHDSNRQIGVVEAARIDGDRTGRARVRFGKAPLAEEVWRDVLDGIRKHVSVGYVIHDLKRDDSDPDGDTYRATDWEPLEISIVSVPADASVGVGRSGDTKPQPRRPAKEIHPMPDDIRDDVLDAERNEMARDAEDHVGQDAVDDTTSADDEVREPSLARRAEISRMRAYGADHRLSERAEELIAADGTLADLKAAHRRRLTSTPPEPLPATRDTRIEMHFQRHQPLRGFRNEEAAYRNGQWILSTIYGNERAARWCRDNYVRAGSTATVASGGAVVPEEMSQAIIDLRNEFGVARRLARVVPMNSDTLSVPRAVSDMTGYWGAQNGSMTDSDVSWDQVQLVAKKLYAYCKLSTEYVEDAAIDVAGDIVTRMARVFAEKEDEAFINGDGTSTYGGIYGLRPKIINGSFTAGAVDAASGVDTYAEVTNTDITTALGKVPTYARRGAVILCSPVARDVVFSRLSAASGGTTMTELAGQPLPGYLGRPLVESESMPSSTGDLSNVAMLLMGNFMLSSTLGERRGFTVAVDSSVHFQSDQIAVRGTERVDIVNHDLGDTSTAGPVVALVGE